jgi:hypothetical protein
MGEAHTALARVSRMQRDIQLGQACSWYEKSAAANQRIPSWRPITPAEFDSLDPKLIAARLATCHGAKALGVRSGA